MLKIGLIGGGHMGMAIVSRTYKKFRIAVSEKNPQRIALLKKKYHVAILDIPTLVKTSSVLILAVKPQDMETVLKDLRKWDAALKDVLIISIAAGLTTRYFEKRLGQTARVIRVMPNMPAQIGLGITALCQGKKTTRKDLATAVKIFSFIGDTVLIDEKLMDSVTAVSGSGPAYIFHFVECFLSAAVKAGLPSDMAKKLVQSTLAGSVALLDQSKENPGDLRLKVTSKGGTTQAAMDIFLDNNFEKMFTDAVLAAKIRAGWLSQ